MSHVCTLAVRSLRIFGVKREKLCKKSLKLGNKNEEMKLCHEVVGQGHLVCDVSPVTCLYNVTLSYE